MELVRKRQSLYEQTTIRRGATIGANATIVCGTTIGRYAFIAAGAVVARDVPDYGFVLGVPGRVAGWMSRHGHRLTDPDENGLMVCPESGYRYQEKDGALRCLDLDEEAVAGRAAAARAVLGALERDEDVVPVARVVDVVHVALLDAPLRQRLAPAHLHQEIPQASTRAFPVSGLAVLAGRRPDSASQPAALAAQARLLFYIRCARAA